MSVLIVLGLLLWATAAQAQGVLDATWQAPTTNTDGSALTDMASYKVYLGPALPICPGTNFVSVPTSTPAPTPTTTEKAHLTGLTVGTTYFVAVTAIDTGGNESACSLMASAPARAAAGAPPSTPGTPQISQVSSDATGVTFSATWAPSTGTPTPTYNISGGYNDGSAPFNGSTASTTFRFKMPYPTGTNATAWTCIQAVSGGVVSVDNSCNGFTVPVGHVPVPGTNLKLLFKP